MYLLIIQIVVRIMYLDNKARETSRPFIAQVI